MKNEVGRSDGIEYSVEATHGEKPKAGSIPVTSHFVSKASQKGTMKTKQRNKKRYILEKGYPGFEANGLTYPVGVRLYDNFAKSGPIDLLLLKISGIRPDNKYRLVLEEI